MNKSYSNIYSYNAFFVQKKKHLQISIAISKVTKSH